MTTTTPAPVQQDQEQLQMLCLHEEFYRHHRPGDAIPGKDFSGGLPMALGEHQIQLGGGFFLGRKLLPGGIFIWLFMMVFFG